MVKFLAKDEKSGRVMLGIGLTHANMVKLLAGQPILFSAEDLRQSYA